MVAALAAMHTFFFLILRTTFFVPEIFILGDFSRQLNSLLFKLTFPRRLVVILLRTSFVHPSYLWACLHQEIHYDQNHHRTTNKTAPKSIKGSHFFLAYFYSYTRKGKKTKFLLADVNHHVNRFVT